MNLETDQQIGEINVEKNGEIDETGKYSDPMKQFLVNYYSVPSDQRTRQNSYDSFTELHISGGNANELHQAMRGEITPEEVGVLYENGHPIKIHVRYAGGNDLYLSKRALEDFLSFAG